MVLIFSVTNDSSTTEVIKWLHCFEIKEITRLNADKPNYDFISYENSEKEKIIIATNDQEIDLLENKISWYRRGKNLFQDKGNPQYDGYLFSDHDKHIRNNILSELKVLSDYFYRAIENQGYSLSLNRNSSLNKLSTLEEAKRVGLKTPESQISSSRKQLLDIISRKGNLVTKALSDGVYLFFGGTAYYSYTELINKKNLEKLPTKFFPSLTQVLIEKQYEVRSFFLEGRFYSMAIFSQNDDQTKVDFRKYNNLAPNRNVPYNLPKTITEKLKLLFKKLNLNTGSVDLIKDKKGNYIFLEINPVGQFSMVSYPCNYYLEKKIALIIKKKWKNLL